MFDCISRVEITRESSIFHDQLQSSEGKSNDSAIKFE